MALRLFGSKFFFGVPESLRSVGFSVILVLIFLLLKSLGSFSLQSSGQSWLFPLSWSSKYPVLGSGVLGSVDCWLFFRVLLFLLSVLSLHFVVCFMFVSMFLRCCWSDLFHRFRSCCAWIQSFELSLSFSCCELWWSLTLLVDWTLVCFLSFELNRSWSSIGLGSILVFLAFWPSFSSTRLVIWHVSLWVRRSVVGCPVSCVSVSCVLVLSMQSPKGRSGASLGTRIGGACNHEFLATHVWPPKVSWR